LFNDGTMSTSKTITLTVEKPQFTISSPPKQIP